MSEKAKSKSLAFVTSNKHKFAIAAHTLDIPLELVSLELDEIQSLDLVEIASYKAKQAYAVLGRPLLVDDTGLHINTWKGFPGSFAKYIGTLGGPQLLLDMMRGQEDRSAQFVTAIAYYDGEHIHTTEGRLEGNISFTVRGNDWGFTPVFIPEGHDKTLSELKAAGVQISTHRSRALEQIKSKIMQ